MKKGSRKKSKVKYDVAEFVFGYHIHARLFPDRDMHIEVSWYGCPCPIDFVFKRGDSRIKNRAAMMAIISEAMKKVEASQVLFAIKYPLQPMGQFLEKAF